MRGSIERKAFLTAVAAAALPVAAIWIGVRSPVARALVLLWAVAVLSIVWVAARSLSKRVRELTAFAERLLEPGVARTALRTSDDELGELGRSLARTAPRVEELVSRLSTELTRREAILASMTEAVLAVDARLNVTFCNSSFTKAVGDHEMSEGVPLIKVARNPELFRVLKQVIDTGEPVRTRLQLPASESRSYEVYAAPLATSSARGAIAILHDVTPRERLERVKRDFIANVSHEIRTPLATIRGYAETLLEGGLEDEENRRRFVEIIQANGVRLNNIAADLLTLSELESGRPEAQAGPIALSEVVQGAIRAVEPAASLMGVHIKTDPIPDVQVLGHGIRLEQAFLNLLDNAVKFNKPNGEVHVWVRTRSDRHVEIRISDTGVGIPPDDRSRIFERFYRVDKARSRQVGGTGLGLSIVKHAIEQMHGTVAVESELGKGSTFLVTLPPYRQS